MTWFWIAFGVWFFCSVALGAAVLVFDIDSPPKHAKLFWALACIFSPVIILATVCLFIVWGVMEFFDWVGDRLN